MPPCKRETLTACMLRFLRLPDLLAKGATNSAPFSHSETTPLQHAVLSVILKGRFFVPMGKLYPQF
jgi:hypothetical protein